MNQKLVVRFSLIGAACLTLAACGGESKEAPAAPAAPAKPAASAPAAPAAASVPAAPSAAQSESKDYFADAAALQKAEDSLKALPQFGGKPLRIFQSVKFYNRDNNSISIDVIDPNKPENVDHYEYSFKDQKWSDPEPVKLSGGGDMNANSTELDKIKFAQVADPVAKLWKEKAKEVQAKAQVPDYVMFQLWVPNQDRYWQAPMATERADYTLRVKLDGTIKDFNK